MANHNTLFSAALIVSEEEKKWFSIYLYETPEVDQELLNKLQVDYGGMWNFHCKLEKEEGYDTWEVHFFSMDQGDPYQVCLLVHEFFKANRLEGDDEFVLQWAATCDKPRLDSFGGGTLVVTKDGIGMCGDDEQLVYARANIVGPWLEVTDE
jgi:hypothetical protein